MIDLERTVAASCSPIRRAWRWLPGTPVPALPFMAALAVATEDLRASRAVLAQNGVRAHELDTGILAAAIPGGLAGSICFVADGGVATWLAGG